MQKIIIIGALAFLAAIVFLNRYESGGELPQANVSGQQLNTELIHLRQRLAQEIEVRTALQQQVAKLERQLAAQCEDEPGEKSDSGQLTSRQTSTAKPDTLASALAKSGLDQQSIDAILKTYGHNRMSLLEIRNTAVREGWVNTERYDRAIKRYLSPGRDIQQRFGDDAYDHFLYAYGNTNRVRVAGIYPGSAAEVAGVEIGDVILTYASTNIFTMAGLQNATAQGNPGESILLVVDRNNQSYYLNVPRGPLGIEMAAFSQAPE